MRSGYRLVVASLIAGVIATSLLVSLKAVAASSETALIAQVISSLSAQYSVAVDQLSTQPRSEPAPEAPDDKFVRSKRKIAGRYIVVLDDETAGPRGENSRAAEVANELSAIHGGRIDRVYTHAINGFSAEMNESRAIAISHDPRVKYVEEDSEITLNATQTNATWGIDRVDQRGLPVDTLYNYNQTGAGVRAYVIDSGIRTTHADFGGRATVGFDALGGSGQDCMGHGTHVAGTLGGTTWGVAKNVSLVAVRVFDCFGNGSTSTVLAGVNWVTAQPQRPAVVNMSLGYEAFESGTAALDTAVNNSINSGFTYVVAAGNSNKTACDISPARVGPAITVGATDMADQRATFSNFGMCVDLFAPGVGITSAWHTSDTATTVQQGTSMAAPHVAGAAAMYLQANPGATQQQVRAFLVSEATKNIVGNSSSTNNQLLFTFWGATPIVPVNVPPTASFTYDCSAGQTCTFDGTGSNDPDGTVVEYHWNFGDGFTATGPTAQRTFNFIGNTTVSLTVSDNMGEASFPESKTITIFNTPVGNNVTVNDRFGRAKVTFQQVTIAGNTSFDDSTPLFVIPTYGNTLCNTCTPFSIFTSATWVAPATVSIDVPEGISEQTFNSMSMLRYANFENPPADITTNRITNPDGTREIIGQSSAGGANVGFFVLATQLAGPPPQTPPTLSNTAVTSVNENGTATLTGNISDPNAGDTFTLTVNWGDGSAPQIFNYAAGTTSFSETHRYLDNPAGQPNGSYTVTMTLADSAGGSAAPWSLFVGVANVAPTLSNITATPATITAGGSTTITGNITEPGTLDGITVTIDWRDPTSGSTVIDLPAGTTTFSAQHQYNQSGIYDLNIGVRDKDFAATPYNPAVSVTVNDTPPPDLTNVSATSPINENGTTSLTGNIGSQSPGATFSLLVNWGDGSQPQTFNYQAGATSFNETHQYLDSGVYAINLTLTASPGGQDTASTSATVNNLAPVVSGLQLNPASITAGGATTLTAASIDPGPLDTQTVSVNWGDGTPNTMLPLNAGETAISSAHQYTQAGNYNIDVTSTDKDGAQATSSIPITVVAPPPPPSPTPVPPRVPDAPFTEIGLDGSAFAGLTPGPDNGRLYGVTYDGPVSDNEGTDPRLDAGTIYSVDRNLANRIDHYRFITATDGNTPYNELTWVPAEGKFFGATSAGAVEGGGKIFTFDPVTNAFATMPGGLTGEIWGSLVLMNGYLYGTVQSFPQECIFRLRPSDFAYTPLHCVSWGSSLQGVTPGGDGWLYGNSLYAGQHCDPTAPGRGCGEIFKIRPWNDGETFDPQYQVIFQFQFYGGNSYPCPPGDKFCVRFPVSHNYPVQKLIFGSDGNLYGATYFSVFRLNPNAANVTDSFRTLWTDGGGIQATVIEGLDGRLYFTDYGGGSDGTGRIASMNKDGSGVFELRNFDRDGVDSTANGPWGRLFHDPLTNRIYGTSEYTGTTEPWPGTAYFIEVPPTQYRLSGSPDGTAPVSVDDALDVFVNDALVYTDGIAPSGNRPPIPIPEGYFRPGDIVRFEVRDVYGNCRMLSPIYLVDNFGNSSLMTPGIEISCGWPAGDNGVVFSDTFTIPGTANSAPVISGLTAPSALSENGVANLSFLVSDPNAGDTLTITVNWGDESPNTVTTTPAASNIAINLFHQYLDDDPSSSPSDAKLITVTVTDGLAIDTESHGILINNLQPFFIGAFSLTSPITVGESTNLNGAFGDTGTLDSFTVFINWGDGSQPTQFARAADQRNFTQQHQYNAAGNFTITVTVRDDDTGESSSSIGITVNAIPPPPVPAAPTGLTAAVQSIAQVNLGWTDASGDETEFRIERCSGGKRCNNFSQIATVATNVIAFSDQTVNRNTNYHYRVRACNTSGCSAYSNTAVVKTPRK